MVTSIAAAVGGTPLLELRRLSHGPKHVLLKLELLNPGGSIKSRPAAAIIRRAEQSGLVGAGSVIVVPTGGNLGVGIAMASIGKGYRLVFVIPDNYSASTVSMLRSLGACVKLSDSKSSTHSHVELARALCAENPEFVLLDQLSDPANPESHFQGTGSEIAAELKDCNYFLAGVGSGGTISGAGHAIKDKFPHAQVIAVQPEGCDVMAGCAIPHRIQGLCLGLIPPVFDTTIVDDVISISESQAITSMRELARQEGVIAGISTGANVAAAIEMQRRLGTGSTIVTVAPDTGLNYREYYSGEDGGVTDD